MHSSLNTTALIGHSGFVGSTLVRQHAFDELYRSTNIGDIQGRNFSLVVCCGAPAQKWLANKEPSSDRSTIQSLISHLEKISADKFVLISTVDVFQDPNEIDETTVVDESSLHPYGLHRRYLEKFIADRFPNYLIVRLPGLVGPGLRKNIVYDFLNHNNVNLIDSRGVFQFYPMVNLWADIEIAISNNLTLLHLTAEPISAKEIAVSAFNLNFNNELRALPARYDMRSRYATLFGGTGNYQYTKKESLLIIRAYAQSEQSRVFNK